MTISDCINLTSALFTAIGVITSLGIAIATLKQSSLQAKESREMNEKMLEESSRPYLYLYIKPSYKVGTTRTLALKNFGQSAAKIDFVELPEILLMPLMEDKGLAQPFSNLEKTIFPPGYEITTEFEYAIQKENPLYSIKIKYSSNSHIYEEELSVNLKQSNGHVQAGAITGGDPQKRIDESLQIIASSLYSKF